MRRGVVWWGLGWAVALAVLVGIWGGLDGSTVHAQERVTVAVMPFDASVHHDFRQLDVGRQLTNLITDKLVNMGEFDVVERSRIAALLDEQDFGASGRVDPSAAVEIGRLLGAQVLVFGSVTRFEMSSGAGISIGGFSLSGTTGRAALTGRIVDAATGVILGSVEAEGEATGTSFSVRNFGDISFQASEFQNSALGRAVTRAVDDFADSMSDVIDSNKDRVLAAKARAELRGVVVAVIDNGIIVNIGEQHGVRREQRFEVFRLMEVPGIADPVRIPVGVARVISVDPAASVAMLETVTTPVQIGDIVAIQ